MAYTAPTYTKCPGCKTTRCFRIGNRHDGYIDECVSCGYYMVWKGLPPITELDRQLWRRQAIAQTRGLLGQP
jgi:Zn ribbon nucleic-acid-binding protein